MDPCEPSARASLPWPLADIIDASVHDAVTRLREHGYSRADMGYCRAMTSTDPGRAFSLSYELQAADVTDMFATGPARRRARRRIARVAAWTLLARCKR
jgi:hypothetical protein